MSNIKVKAFWPAQYSPSGTTPIESVIDAPIADVKARVVNDLAVTHSFISQGSYQG
jgi:hypothetical protein